ncbi:DUF1080 domain-containing protein [Lentisphaera profundi]|uniref:DUF1080 domain-containing protein n=1 Tax=Lentisphaera profundi TaxID=1658616 RepID=A0ABY7VWF1_9BACT|nr:DUF1080 domain-containing protein [Lentisphaera profundi]WDE97151.1 DUF1080 domain-containing protein [Lentisphaera profundi]
MKFIALLITLFNLGLLAETQTVWTNPTEAQALKDYQIQGEYQGNGYGAQVIALGSGSFSTVVYKGGLPGDGWDEKNKIVLDGVLEADKVILKSSTGARKYYSPKAETFTPVKQFPPKGQINCSGFIQKSLLSLKIKDQTLKLQKQQRTSPTLGAKAPANAIVLFDGSNIEAFTRGRIDEVTKSLHTDARDLYSKEKFNNYSMHLEFMTPYMPSYRGAKRGNSGIYHVWDYELQILDSFGLDGVHSECGGIYKTAAPRINMAYPPLTWQTYDLDFTNSVFKDGKKNKSAYITVKLNGVLVQDNTEIPAKTGGSRKTPEGEAGPFRLQGHGNKIQYRNIWLIKK